MLQQITFVDTNAKISSSIITQQTVNRVSNQDVEFQQGKGSTISGVSTRETVTYRDPSRSSSSNFHPVQISPHYSWNNYPRNSSINMFSQGRQSTTDCNNSISNGNNTLSIITPLHLSGSTTLLGANCSPLIQAELDARTSVSCAQTNQPQESVWTHLPTHQPGLVTSPLLNTTNTVNTTSTGSFSTGQGLSIVCGNQYHPL